MRIYTSDNKRTINVGTDNLWYSVYQTALVRLSEDDKDFLQFAMDFLKTGECVADDAQITARQMELVCRRFRRIVTETAVFDLFDAVIDLLKYADKNNVDTHMG